MVVNWKMKDKKLVWITGASSGIGRAVSLRLAKLGYKVAVTARREEKLKELTNINNNIISYPCDITDRSAIKTLIEKIESEQGNIDIALLNAGARYQSKDLNIFGDSFRKTLEINLFGTVNCLEAITIPMMKRKKGHIAIVSAIGGYLGTPFLGIDYVTSKAAQRIIFESAKIPLEKKNIKLQIICPGFVETDLINDNIIKYISKVPVDKAAIKICDGLESNKFEITFPKILSLLVKLIRIIPYRFSFWLGKNWLKWIRVFNIFIK